MSTKIADLIEYFLDIVPAAGRTQIVKYLYLADLEARKCLGKPLTDLGYILERDGPCHQRILATLDEMDESGRIVAEKYSYRGNRCYSYSRKRRAPKVRLAAEKEFILNHVAELVRKNSLEKLLEIVNETEPVVEAKKRGTGALLKMNLVNNKSRIRGLELERVMKSVKDLDEGKGRGLEEVLAELDDLPQCIIS
jgi:hypothetical protein